MPRCWLISLVLLLAAGNVFSQGEDTPVGEEQDRPQIRAEGSVIEFDAGNPSRETDANTAITPGPGQETGNSSVIELIIGGQSKEGVAKRRTLPVTD
ncbi:MAG: hypothetical protein ACE5GZ_00455 [Gammaproteobacteria bacterium]